MFQRALINTDIHFGKKNNDKIFLEDCNEYIDWSIKIGKEKNIDCYIHMGDWHDNRKNLNINTLYYSYKNIEKISKNFPKVIFILGNHDISFRNNRDINSLEFLKNFENVLLIKEITQIEDCLFVPWLFEEEYGELLKYKTNFIFGHFEMSNFKINSNQIIIDEKKINPDMFGFDTKYVFSGHYHIRQIKKNINNTEIHYIGNCFPHDFNDNNDKERGLAIFNKDNIEYINWENCPRYKTMYINDFFCNILNDEEINKKTTVKIIVDKKYNYDDLYFIKDKLISNGIIRDIIFQHCDYNQNPFLDFNENLHFDTLENIVKKGINLIESDTIDKNILIQIYESLIK